MYQNQPFSLFECLFEFCRGQISNALSSIKAHGPTFLDHLCFFSDLLGRINNHIIEKSLYFEKGPVIILKINCANL